MQCYHAYIVGTIEHMLHVITQYGSTLQDVHWNMFCMLTKKKKKKEGKRLSTNVCLPIVFKINAWREIIIYLIIEVRSGNFNITQTDIYKLAENLLFE